MKKYIALLVLICAQEAQASKKNKTQAHNTSNQTASYPKEFGASDKSGPKDDTLTSILEKISQTEKALRDRGASQADINAMRHEIFKADQMYSTDEAIRLSQIQAIAASHGLIAKRITSKPISKAQAEQFFNESTVDLILLAQENARLAQERAAQEEQARLLIQERKKLQQENARLAKRREELQQKNARLIQQREAEEARILAQTLNGKTREEFKAANKLITFHEWLHQPLHSDEI